MVFAAFVIDAETHYIGHAMTLRRGQAYFNKLVDLDSALADRIRGGLDDPFLR